MEELFPGSVREEFVSIIYFDHEGPPSEGSELLGPPEPWRAIPRKTVDEEVSLEDWNTPTQVLPGRMLTPLHTGTVGPISSPKIENKTPGIEAEYVNFNLLLKEYGQAASRQERAQTPLGQLLGIYQSCFDGDESLWGEHHTNGQILAKMSRELDPNVNLARNHPFLVMITDKGKVLGAMWGFRVNMQRGGALWLQNMDAQDFFGKRRAIEQAIFAVQAARGIPEFKDITYISEAFVDPKNSKNGAVIGHLIHKVMQRELEDGMQLVLGKTIDLIPGSNGPRPRMAKILDAFNLSNELSFGPWEHNHNLQYGLYAGIWRDIEKIFQQYPPDRFSRLLLVKERQARRDIR